MLRLISKLILLGVIFLSLLPVYQVQVVSKKQQEKIIEKFYSNFDLSKETKQPSNTDEIDIGKLALVTKGVLYIPDIDLKVPVYEGTSEKAISEGTGIINGTGDLTGELGINPVITAHNGLANKNLFLNLEKLKIGDVYYIKTDKDTTLQYEVVDIKVVSPINELKTFLIDENVSYTTLRTCTPTGVNTHRLHVTGKLVEFSGEMESPKFVMSNFEYICIALSVTSFVILLVLIIGDIKEKKNEKRKKKNSQNSSGNSIILDNDDSNIGGN